MVNLKKYLLELKEENKKCHKKFLAKAKDMTLKLKELNNIIRVPFGANFKQYLWEEQGGRCLSCNQEISIEQGEIDHIVPFSLGGGNEMANVQLLCRACNRKKGNRDVKPADVIHYLEGRCRNLPR